MVQMVLTGAGLVVETGLTDDFGGGGGGGV